MNKYDILGVVGVGSIWPSSELIKVTGAYGVVLKCRNKVRHNRTFLDRY